MANGDPTHVDMDIGCVFRLQDRHMPSLLAQVSRQPIENIIVAEWLGILRSLICLGFHLWPIPLRHMLVGCFLSCVFRHFSFRLCWTFPTNST